MARLRHGLLDQAPSPRPPSLSRHASGKGARDTGHVHGREGDEERSRRPLGDPLGRVTTVSRGGIALEQNAYDGNGNKTLATDAEGKKTKFEFDAANRLRNKIAGFGSPEVAVTSYQYDAASNLTIERDARAVLVNIPFSAKKTYD